MVLLIEIRTEIVVVGTFVGTNRDTAHRFGQILINGVIGNWKSGKKPVSEKTCRFRDAGLAAFPPA